MSFLGFDDIEDFTNVNEEAFIDCTNFGSKALNIVNILTSDTPSSTPLNAKDKKKLLRVGDKRSLRQRELTRDDMESPMPRNLSLNNALPDEGLDNDKKRMQLLESKIV